MTTTAPARRAGRLPRLPIVVTLALAVCAVVFGPLPWPRPARTTPGWQVAEVAGPLWTLLVGTAIGCAVVAAVMTARATGMRERAPLTWAWVALVLLAAAALVWNALYYAALSAAEPGPVIPVFDWLFTFAPALMAG